MADHSFFQNRDCAFFPCHDNGDRENFNCLFCYCPLYALGDQCGGNFTYTDNGIKDCSSCLRPHKKENYADILRSMDRILEMAKKVK